jgi:hypothetical protein
MGKKCVRGMIFVCLVAVAAVTGSTNSTVEAQSYDPSQLPRLSVTDLGYLGGFRLPAESVNGDSFSIGGRSMTFNPASNSLFVSTRAGRIAEVSIPQPVNNADVNALPFANFLQPFADPTEGHLSQISSDGVAIDGLLVYGNRLYGTATIYYDANNTQRQSHYSRSLQLNQPSFSGWSQVWETGKTGFVSGLMALIPAAWQARLGGPAVTGQCCIPIVGRTSWGPAAFSFDPVNVGQATVAASPLVYYPAEHPTLGLWDGSNPTYGATIQMGGLAIIAGTRTALYVGRNGTGPNCYGNGTGNQSLHGTIGPDGAKWCYDPTTSDKGSHAYPYRYQVWAYDLNDFAAVKAGTKQPWEVMPYGVWPFDLPTPEPSVKLGGVGYDSSRQILYISQLGADKDGYSYRPVIHAIKVAIPAPAATVREVTITSDKASPRTVNESITMSAHAVDGVAPYEYKWLMHDGNAWTAATDWTASSQITWRPSVSNRNYRLGVWVRSARNGGDKEAEASIPFEIDDEPEAVIVTPIHHVTIAANKAAPQAPGTTVTFTASPTGGAGHQYKWWIYEDGWKPMGSWTPSNTFAWTPTAPNAGGRITVWVRNGGNTIDQQDAAAAMDFVIAGTPATPAPTPAPAPAPTPTSGSGTISAVTIGANKVAPQPAGSTITFTALPAGGVAPYQYKWWIYNGDTWVPMTSWTQSSTFAWTPATANAGGRVTVWVRSTGNTADDAEGRAAMDFAIGGSSQTAPSLRATGATIAANMVAPQVPGTTVTFTATGAGGTAPYQYKWWIYNGDAWVPMTGWTSSNTFAWRSTVTNLGGRVTVWVRSAGATADEAQATAAMDFVIK